MLEWIERIHAASRAIRARVAMEPAAGIILGTGLGGLTEHIETEVVIPYEDIPHFPEPTVESHSGRLVCGQLGGRPVMAMEGRFHYYEGYSMKELTFPVRVLGDLGAETLIVSNASGGMNPQYRKGDIVIIEDHVNLMGDNPLIGPNDDALGPRFPDMCAPYDRELIDLAARIALEEGIRAHTGVYVAVAGPNLETRAEYRFLRAIGCDNVGMSTVPEVVVAVHAGMRVLGLSIVTDICLPDALQPAKIEEIIAVAGAADKKLCTIVKRVVAEMAGPA